MSEEECVLGGCEGEGVCKRCTRGITCDCNLLLTQYLPATLLY